MSHPFQDRSANVQAAGGDGMMDVDEENPMMVKGEDGPEEISVMGQSSERLPTQEGRRAEMSVGGWVVMVSGIHPEVTEADVLDLFEDYGRVTAVRLNQSLDTGYLMGYALLQYDSFDQAAQAIEEQNGADFFDQSISVDWAFVRRPSKDEEGRLVERVNEGEIVNTQFRKAH